MNQQTGKTAALYYRVANKQTTDLYLDNQMHTLLCCANEQGFNSFMLYVDVGMSGTNLDRPGFNALKADIEAGRIDRLIIRDLSRIARNYLIIDSFIEWAGAHGVSVVSVVDGEIDRSPICADMVGTYTKLFHSLPRGGGRA